MRKGVIKITPELLLRLLHLPEDYAVTGWTFEKTQDIAILVMGDGLPEACECDEHHEPHLITPRYGVTLHECGHRDVECEGVDCGGLGGVLGTWTTALLTDESPERLEREE